MLQTGISLLEMNWDGIVHAASDPLGFQLPHYFVSVRQPKGIDMINMASVVSFQRSDDFFDRVKAKQANVAVTDAFQALQVYLGSLYINDFNYLGRTYRVTAQADAPFRARAKDVST